MAWAARRWLPRRAPYVFRQGVANLYRPANQTRSVVLALGFLLLLLALQAPLIAAAGVPTVLFGPAGEGLHETEEWVDLPDLDV